MNQARRAFACARFSDQIFAGLLGEDGARHLAECEDCRAELALSRRVTELLDASVSTAPGGVTALSHQAPSNNTARHRWLINQAFLQAGARPQRSRSRSVVSVLLAAIAAAALVTLTWRARVHEKVVATGASARSASAGSSTASFALDEGVSRSLGPVSVSATSQSELSWNESARRLALRRGRLVIDLEPGALPGFQVVTQRFTVEVTGTRFTVDEESVHVERGHVRVISPDRQRVFAASLVAGASWFAVANETATVASNEALPSSTASVAPASPHDAPAANDAVLREARRLLASKDVARARELLNSIKQRPLSTGERLEADSLAAECELVEGRSRAAVEGYSVAARGSTAQTEVAEFAAARLEAERGDPQRARQLLEQYLLHHPQGTFRREARSRLLRLSTSAPP